LAEVYLCRNIGIVTGIVSGKRYSVDYTTLHRVIVSG
jgi:hypothetical protein